MPRDRVITRSCPWFAAFFGRCAVARWLAANGHEAEHVLDLGLSGATDLVIWDHAARADAIIVTKDEDFAQRKTIDLKGPKVVWIRLPNTRTGELLLWFERVFPRVLQAVERGDSLIEIIR
jgi:predicted nuclease of predicted toxin-antitoxin system